MKITHLAPSYADLHYRGYSIIHQANVSSPEIPDYNHLVATHADLARPQGYYTRYGDVRQLLNKIDDRYVIMNAGDELALRFPALRRQPSAGCATMSSPAMDGSRTATTTPSTPRLFARCPTTPAGTTTRRPARWKTNGSIATIPRTGRRIRRATSTSDDFENALRGSMQRR